MIDGTGDGYQLLKIGRELPYICKLIWRKYYEIIEDKTPMYLRKERLNENTFSKNTQRLLQNRKLLGVLKMDGMMKLGIRITWMPGLVCTDMMWVLAFKTKMV